MSDFWKAIEISELPSDMLFEGYYWYSHESKPIQINSQKIDKEIFTQMPFIIEGNFFAPQEQVSISVKNIDGIYRIVRYDLKKEVPLVEIEKSEYLAHDLDGIEKFIMAEAWEPVSDDLLCNMKTLVPTWSAFAGFIKSK